MVSFARGIVLFALVGFSSSAFAHGQHGTRLTYSAVSLDRVKGEPGRGRVTIYLRAEHVHDTRVDSPAATQSVLDRYGARLLSRYTLTRGGSRCTKTVERVVWVGQPRMLQTRAAIRCPASGAIAVKVGFAQELGEEHRHALALKVGSHEQQSAELKRPFFAAFAAQPPHRRTR